MSNETVTPPNLKKKVVVCFKQMNNAKAMNTRLSCLAYVAVFEPNLSLFGLVVACLIQRLTVQVWHLM